LDKKIIFLKDLKFEYAILHRTQGERKMKATQAQGQIQEVQQPPTLEGDPARVRNGVNKSVYLSKKAEGLVDEASRKFRRSDSAVLSILAERYLPRILADEKARL
jgi:hypothetical protein